MWQSYISLCCCMMSQIQWGFSETAVDIRIKKKKKKELWQRYKKSQRAIKKKKKKCSTWSLLFLRFDLFFFFLPSSSPLLSRDNGGTVQSGRWQCHGERRQKKVQGCKISLQHNQQISGCCFICMYILHYTGSPAYRKVAVISLPSCSFCITGQFLLDCTNTLHRGERLVGLGEIIGRLTCFMTTDHWLMLALHKNGHFYTECFSDDTRQEWRVRLRNEPRGQANNTHHLLSLGKWMFGSFTNTSTHALFFLFSFFFYFAPAHSAPTGLMSSTITVSILVT